MAGEPITAKLTRAPGNDAAIGGLKVTSASGWFAARPSGTEDVYKLYAESFKSQAHLDSIVAEGATNCWQRIEWNMIKDEPPPIRTKIVATIGPASRSAGGPAAADRGRASTSSA